MTPSPGRMAVWRGGVTALALAGVAGAVALVTPAVSHSVQHVASSSAGAREGIAIDGVGVYKVDYDGRLISIARYESHAVPAASRAGRRPHLILDGSARSRGYLVAYDSQKKANAYMVAHHMPLLSAWKKQPAANVPPSGTAGTPVRLGTTMATLTACSLPNHAGDFYDGTDCNGAELGIGYPDAVPKMSTYGWDNRASSIALGDCIGDLHTWNSNNYTGAPGTFGGDDVYTALGPQGGANINNSISSFKSISEC
jgi:hypothetical protein